MGNLLPIDILIKADLRKTPLDKLLSVGSNRLLMPILVDKDNNDTIEVIPVKSYAGYRKGFSNPQFFSKLPTMRLPFHVTGKHRTFPIKGDSMPSVPEGSYVVGKFVETLQDVTDGETYVILTQSDGLVYKRAFKKGKGLELHSDNTAYKPYFVAQDEIRELWKFVSCISLSDKKGEPNIESVIALLRQLDDKK